jgi:hypothetical protein
VLPTAARPPPPPGSHPPLPQQHLLAIVFDLHGLSFGCSSLLRQRRAPTRACAAARAPG